LIITEKVFEDSVTISTVAPSVGLAMVIALLVDLNTDTTIRRKSSFLFVRIAAYLSAVSSVATLLTKGGNPTKLLCYNNSIAQSQRDGISVCVVQGILLLYCIVAVTFAWLAQLVFLYLRIVREVDTDRYTRHGMVAVLGIPVIAIAYLLQQNLIGYNGKLPWCNFITLLSTTDNHGEPNAPKQVFFIFAGTGALLGTVGTFCIASMLFKYMSNLRRTIALIRPADIEENITDSSYPGGASFWTMMAKFGGPTALFHFGFAAIWIAVLFFPMTVAIYKGEYVSLYLSWKACVFSTYFQDRLGLVTEDAGRLWNIAKDQCGESPRFRQNISGGDTAYHAVVFIISGQSIIISLVFLPSRIARYLSKRPPTRGMVRYENWMKRMQSLSAALANGARVYVAPPSAIGSGAVGVAGGGQRRDSSLMAAVMNVMPAAAPKILSSRSNFSLKGAGVSWVSVEPRPPPRLSADGNNFPTVLRVLAKLDNAMEQKSGSGSGGRLTREQFKAENGGSSGSRRRRTLEGLMGAGPHHNGGLNELLQQHQDDHRLHGRFIEELIEGSEFASTAAKSDTKAAERKN
jgi:hypothetical protein